MAVANSERLGTARERHPRPRAARCRADAPRSRRGQRPRPRPGVGDGDHRARPSAAGIRLAVEPAPDGPTSMCRRRDPHRMVQVLTNLLGNAIKFSDRGSTSSSGCRVPTTQVLDRRHRPGPGHPGGPAVLRLRPVRPGRHRGRPPRQRHGPRPGHRTGDRRAQRRHHRGRERAGRGQYLHRDRARAHALTAPQETTSVTHRILVVDDDDDVRRLASMALSRVGGHEVTSVSSGAECLAALARTACPTPSSWTS